MGMGLVMRKPRSSSTLDCVAPSKWRSSIDSSSSVTRIVSVSARAKDLAVVSARAWVSALVTAPARMADAAAFACFALARAGRSTQTASDTGASGFFFSKAASSKRCSTSRTTTTLAPSSASAAVGGFDGRGFRAVGGAGGPWSTRATISSSAAVPSAASGRMGASDRFSKMSVSWTLVTWDTSISGSTQHLGTSMCVKGVWPQCLHTRSLSCAVSFS
mmetsp:Transcript_35529/g.120370  ORF Transcript_35529/g.120370 Transcript_35529/m.120370 type:complete len:218 (+) Transcript_35529:410-1063(+)